jgi:hypothetical protein
MTPRAIAAELEGFEYSLGFDKNEVQGKIKLLFGFIEGNR